MQKIVYLGVGIVLGILIAGVIKFNFINDGVYIQDENGEYTDNKGEKIDIAYMKDMGYCRLKSDCIKYKDCCKCSSRNKYFIPINEMDCSAVDCQEFKPKECDKEAVCLKGRCVLSKKR